MRHGFRYGIEINGNGASGSKVEGNYIGTDVSGEQNRDLLVKEDGSLTERGEAIVDHTPAGRFGEPDELVGTLLWLCGPGASFVTGVVVPVDGGFSAFSGGLACGCYIIRANTAARTLERLRSNRRADRVNLEDLPHSIKVVHCSSPGIVV